MDNLTVILRVGAALALGAVLGLNRDIRGKPAGVRTHGLVSVGSATVLLVAIQAGAGPEGVTRVLQGLLAGIGFLGAGVIIHHQTQHRVHGLTTAASVWVAAGLGAACGAGLVSLAAIALVAGLIVLVAGGPIERAFEQQLGTRKDPAAEPDGSDRPSA
ncbi:MAG TPA: MgtC/SapB family protein [Usitatibacter sp.]|nr:MgtC/SapB family protein [Usitatibacter sp.]